MSRVKAWMFPVGECDQQTILYQRGRAADYLLELLRQLSATTSVFSVGYSDNTDRPGAPIKNASYFSDVLWFKAPAAYRVVLLGSPMRHRIANAFFNETAQRLELTLEAEALVSQPSPTPNAPPSALQQKLETIRNQLRPEFPEANVTIVDGELVNFVSPGFNPHTMRREEFDALPTIDIVLRARAEFQKDVGGWGRT